VLDLRFGRSGGIMLKAAVPHQLALPSAVAQVVIVLKKMAVDLLVGAIHNSAGIDRQPDGIVAERGFGVCA
jgi:hypothetical protein